MTRRAWIVVATSLFSQLSPTMFARKKKTLGVKTRKPSVVSWPQELRGSKQQRVEQNTKAINLGIGQIATDSELLTMVGDGKLIELKNSDHYFVERGVRTKSWKTTKRVGGKKITKICNPKTNKVFVYPWVKEYLDKFAADCFIKFKRKKKLKITSGARSLEEQKEMRTPGSCYYEPSAAKVVSDLLEESLHVRAIAIDISRKGMSKKEIIWIRDKLVADKINGVEFVTEDQYDPVELETDPIEERACYHVVVFSK